MKIANPVDRTSNGLGFGFTLESLGEFCNETAVLLVFHRI